MDRMITVVDPVPGIGTHELALAELHATLTVGDRLRIRFPGPTVAASDLLEGAGFEIESGSPEGFDVIRGEMLPDTVGPVTQVLVVGLNPGTHSTASGCAFAGPGNRFWPATVGAGITVNPRDPITAARADGLALTNLVRRTTPRAADLAPAEYRAGVPRLERLVRRVRPAVVCFVGLAGYRAAFDPKAVAGAVTDLVPGFPTYAMPSTSGLNARSSLPELIRHFRAAAALGHSRSGISRLPTRPSAARSWREHPGTSD